MKNRLARYAITAAAILGLSGCFYTAKNRPVRLEGLDKTVFEIVTNSEEESYLEMKGTILGDKNAHKRPEFLRFDDYDFITENGENIHLFGSSKEEFGGRSLDQYIGKKVVVKGCVGYTVHMKPPRRELYMNLDDLKIINGKKNEVKEEVMDLSYLQKADFPREKDYNQIKAPERTIYGRIEFQNRSDKWTYLNHFELKGPYSDLSCDDAWILSSKEKDKVLRELEGKEVIIKGKEVMTGLSQSISTTIMQDGKPVEAVRMMSSSLLGFVVDQIYLVDEKTGEKIKGYLN